jgi:acyl-CoA thioester hydrolase
MTMQKNSPLEDGVHHTQVRVRFGDTDHYGIVYFVSYFRYCHRAIEEFLGPWASHQKRPLRTSRKVSAYPSWRPGVGSGAPAGGDLLDIETRIQEMRPKAVVFRFESYPETGRDLLIEGTATLPIGPEWRARDLPERIKSLVSGTMKPGFKQTS